MTIEEYREQQMWLASRILGQSVVRDSQYSRPLDKPEPPENSKICTKCGKLKMYEHFYKHKKCAGGVESMCKDCKRSYPIDVEKKRLCNRKSYHKNKYKNRYKHAESKSLWYREKRASDPLFRFKDNMRKTIAKTISNRTSIERTENILCCSFDYFIKHMESQFVDGMNWDNYGDWHVDHIIPMASAKNRKEALLLNHYTNLQPLWAEDNLSKSDTYKEEDKIAFLNKVNKQNEHSRKTICYSAED